MVQQKRGERKEPSKVEKILTNARPNTVYSVEELEQLEHSGKALKRFKKAHRNVPSNNVKDTLTIARRD